MGADSFSFKQFIVRHDRCGQKVGTDGVLIGTWAKGGKRILDIGTGSGLIALMMAQRFSNAEICGIEINHETYRQACGNVDMSQFASQISLENCSLQSFFATYNFYSNVIKTTFFVDSLKTQDIKRNYARHTDSLSFEELISHSVRLMDNAAYFSMIIPTDYIEQILSVAATHGLRLSRRCDIKTVDRKRPKRSLLELTNRRDTIFVHEIQVLNTADGQRSDWYQKQTSDFYL